MVERRNPAAAGCMDVAAMVEGVVDALPTAYKHHLHHIPMKQDDSFAEHCFHKLHMPRKAVAVVVAVVVAWKDQWEARCKEHTLDD